MYIKKKQMGNRGSYQKEPMEASHANTTLEKGFGSKFRLGKIELKHFVFIIPPHTAHRFRHGIILY